MESRQESTTRTVYLAHGEHCDECRALADGAPRCDWWGEAVRLIQTVVVAVAVLALLVGGLVWLAALARGGQ